MAAAVLPNIRPNPVSNPLPMSPRGVDAATASPSRLGHAQASGSRTFTPEVPEPSPKSFKRLRSSLEQSIRNATKSKAKSPPPVDDEFARIMAKADKGKGKEASESSSAPKEKEREKSKMLRRLQSQVGFRKPGKVSTDRSDTPAATPPIPGKPREGNAPRVTDLDDDREDRVPGLTPFQPPSLRQASMSSPAVYLSAQPSPLPKPSRDRSKRSSLQPSTSSRDISGPTPLAPRRDSSRVNGNASSSSAVKDSSRDHRAPKHRPAPLLPSSPSTVTLPGPDTPTRRTREPISPPETPTPGSSSRPPPILTARKASASASHLPLNERSISPIPISPPRSPTSRRVVTPTQRGLVSASTSHLPLNPPTSPTTGRRPSFDANRRPSLDASRPFRPTHSPSASRSDSPSTQLRPRAVSPTYANHNRGYNASTTSLSSPSNPEHRELIRNASSLLCKEMARPPVHHSKIGIAKDWEEVEVRLRALARLERVWGKSGANVSQSSLFGPMSSSGLSTSGEERERRLFSEALRDGYVLCQLVNKLRSNPVIRPDPREDGFVRTSNVTKFLAACAQFGVAADELFQRDDLINGDSESLARVARTVIALLRVAEFPPADRAKFLSGGDREALSSRKQSSSTSHSGPYGQGASSHLAASSPNLSLAQAQRSTSPTGPGSPMGKKRWSPPTPLPTVRSDSPESGSGSGSGRTERGGTAMNHGRSSPGASSERDEVPPILSPPPRSPLRARSYSKPTDARNGASPERISVADSTRASIGGDSIQASLADSMAATRQSLASSAVSDTTAFSSLLEVNRSNSSGQNKFGTIRTVTTEATSFIPSDPPSFTRSEASGIAAALAEDNTVRKRTESNGKRERRPSEVAVIDLSRVVEEAEEASASSGRKSDRSKSTSRRTDDAVEERLPRTPQIRLGKGKWPDDFMDAFHSPASPTRSSARSPTSELDDRSGATSPISISPPRKLAYVGASRQNESVDSLPQFAPRRPTHRPRHSIDAPVLLPKENLLRRDSSPDSGLSSGSPRVMLRRSSTKTGANRNGMYVPRLDEPRSPTDADPRVPFPRTVSGEHLGTGQGSSADVSRRPTSPAEDKPRQPRGRFQSEIEGSSSRRRPRPNSYDDMGAKPGRTRFESMVNLGVVSSNASASDLMSRNSMDGSAVRETLIVREDGKASTQFQLGNCIGRGQFGSVYRALNLNTGQMVAVKRIRLEGLKEDEISQLMGEVDLLKSLSHPSIVKYEGMARDADTLSIVLEYAENGSLGQTIKAFGKLNERLVATYVVKILEGLDYLHQNDVVHCDLKAANILTTKNGNVKLSDFGVSLNLRAMEREMKDVAGTPNWMAPEVIELKGASPKSDIWSLACTVIELLTGRPPYADIANSMTVMFRIVEDDAPPLPEGCSDLLKDFLTQCFHKDPAMRPSAEMLCEHEWLKKNWIGAKELRPQDSIPFLRRVSADMHKQSSEAVQRYLAGVDIPKPSPTSGEFFSSPDDTLAGSPPKRRLSNTPSTPISHDSDGMGPREHSFVKTTFSKSMMCRVCLQGVKKHAVLCEQCSLIAHSKCAANAPPTCDLRSQLLLFAQYAEKGVPGSAYTSAMEAIAAAQIPGSSPSSEVGVLSSPRTSIDSPPLQSPLVVTPHPPTAFKMMGGVFKRSRSSLSAETVDSHSATSLPIPPSSPPPMPPPVEKPLRKKHSVLKRNREGKDRPRSISSNSTTPNTASMRSALTTTESFKTAGRNSVASGSETETGRGSDGPFSSSGGSESQRASKVSALSDVSEIGEASSNRIPGDISTGTKRHRRRDRDSKSSNGGCVVQ
ncbi:hypothetical protein GLOTRDRAFT_120867 [Gloeophyllum trabeum ATCC 11539]|uniref:Pkinase-domain-containing protein n=1 Tax=Gloeophyllum trabeum (strain ATCC 11539 / FP-39264 / Madison 617) TaxID=670483 RepID=S7QAA6_GLOTA|nr:uncharacterized protein GLOTRDRAFT_120867 [Gloeophyllum trabeum ATCC 11539]EPQ56313.1 hypothetical protein GLOTRDRAFT_120867 [Gloeophyllum trabeum ATCC 11539]